jgi:hypothetical protein
VFGPARIYPARVFLFSVHEIGRQCARHGATSPIAAKAPQARCRPNRIAFTLNDRSRANVPVAARGCAPLRPPIGDRVRARNGCRAPRPAAPFFLESAMTAYLISLALAGLLLVVLWEALG